jgi:hypothetical protein
MKKMIMKGLVALMPAMALISCSKSFLNVVPLGKQVAGTVSDYNLLLNSQNFYMYGNGGGWQELAMMGDEVAAENPYLPVTYPQTLWAFQWRDTIWSQTDVLSYDLSEELLNLYTCNKVITEVPDASGGTESMKTQLRAEALAIRGWLNMQFVNFYAKPYNASTAATDPGFPIITAADINLAKFERSAVAFVYAAIIQDLTAAIPGLPLTASAKTRISKPAAEALLGRVYLYMGRYSDALTQFNTAFNDITAAGTYKLYDYNVEFAPGGAFAPSNPFLPANPPGNNYNDVTEALWSVEFFNGSAASASGLSTASAIGAGSRFGNNGIVITPRVAALYNTGDLRLKLYAATNPNGSLNVGGRLRKSGVTYSRCGIQLPDLYLMRAECEARLNNVSAAQADLETLRQHRMPAAKAAVPSDTLTNQTALIQYVLDERIREFAAEGYRWWDMRRLSVDPLFAGTVYTHTLYNDDAQGSSTIYTLKQPDRLTLKLTPALLLANPGMTDNP